MEERYQDLWCQYSLFVLANNKEMQSGNGLFLKKIKTDCVGWRFMSKVELSCVDSFWLNAVKSDMVVVCIHTQEK